ncbi:hypothetical protein N619_31730 [Ectopseudomonas oleovorans]|nr:hypothetical protein N619_31730 [Pseudomonas oleovorans]
MRHGFSPFKLCAVSHPWQTRTVSACNFVFLLGVEQFFARFKFLAKIKCMRILATPYCFNFVPLLRDSFNAFNTDKIGGELQHKVRLVAMCHGQWIIDQLRFCCCCKEASHQIAFAMCVRTAFSNARYFNVNFPQCFKERRGCISREVQQRHIH